MIKHCHIPSGALIICDINKTGLSGKDAAVDCRCDAFTVEISTMVIFWDQRSFEKNEKNKV
jgi:hypothetical protein